MVTRYLEEFLSFAEDANWSAAAKRLFVTRPTLVEHIKALENELGCSLVQADGQHPRLTAAGRQFIPVARDYLQRWSKTCKEFEAMADNLLTVTVASTNLPWIEGRLYRARRAIHERQPYKRIEIQSVPGALSNIDDFESRAEDIAVVGFKTYRGEDEGRLLPSGTVGFKLCRDTIMLIVTQDSPLFGKDRLCAHDLDGATLVLPPDIYSSWERDAMVSRFLEVGAHITLETRHFADHSEYFAFDFCTYLGIVPASLAPRFGIDCREDCRLATLDDWQIESDFYVVFKQSFVQTENGALLFAEMQREASA